MSPIFTYAAELYREMREEFELTVEAAHAAAEEGTRGSMLNKHGRAEGIDAYSLMTGPWSRVERYGSPELIEWCEEHGRPSVARFEREWFTSWLGEDMTEVDALQEQLDGIRAVYTPERMTIERAIAAADPPRMMNRTEANQTLNKVLDILGSVEPSPYRVLPANTVVQFKMERPDDWGDAFYPALSCGQIIGVQTTNGLDPIYRIQISGGVLDGKTFDARPSVFVVQL